MFERLTAHARHIIDVAHRDALLSHSPSVDTEHLLVALFEDEGGVAAIALTSLGIYRRAVVARLPVSTNRRPSPPLPRRDSLPWSPQAKKVLELSLREALQLGHAYIGTEHILLGLIREGEGVAAQVLVRLGADLWPVRQRVVGILSGTWTPPPGPPEVVSDGGVDWAALAAAMDARAAELLGRAAAHDTPVREAADLLNVADLLLASKARIDRRLARER